MDAFPPATSSNAHVYPTVEAVSASTPSPITRTNFGIANGEVGTFQALELMAMCVRGECEPDFSGFGDEFNYRAMAGILGSKSKTAEASVAALFQFVRDRIRYVDHPANEQVVQDCRRTLEIGSGDCVSKSVCLSTLLACRGIDTQFVAQHPSDEQGFSHVYVETADGIPLDAIADGRDGRPFYQIGERQRVPDGGFETPWKIFD